MLAFVSGCPQSSSKKEARDGGAPPGTDVAPVVFDDHICLQCKDFFTPPLVQKHLAGFEPRFETDTQLCAPNCAFHAGEELVQISPSCGLTGQNASEKAQALLDPTLGHSLRITRDDEQWFAADAWDSDTPCVFYMTWHNPPRKDRTLALAKDLLATATPALVAKRTLEVLVATKDGTADEPAAALAAWASQKPALEALLPLPGGLPKVVDSGMHPRLPQGNKYLALAYCPPLSSNVDNLYALAFPKVSYHVVEAKTASCPTIPEGWDLGRPTVVSLGKRELRAGILQRKDPTQEDSPFARAVVMLVDRTTGSVLDWKRLDFQWGEADMPTTRVTNCRVFAEAEKGALSVTRSCAWDGTYETCDQDPLEAVSDTFTVKADKLAVKRTTEMTPGRRCVPID